MTHAKDVKMFSLTRTEDDRMCRNSHLHRKHHRIWNGSRVTVSLVITIISSCVMYNFPGVLSIDNESIIFESVKNSDVIAESEQHLSLSQSSVSSPLSIQNNTTIHPINNSQTDTTTHSSENNTEGMTVHVRNQLSEACIGIQGDTDPNCIQNEMILIDDDKVQEQHNGMVQMKSSSESSNDGTLNEDDETLHSLPNGCKLVFAPSTIPSSGWGMFTMVDIPRGNPVGVGDVVIQVSDLNVTFSDPTVLLLHDYLWNSEETGGYYEGEKIVLSVAPGTGMLANGLPHRSNNVLPHVPTVDEGGLTRTDSPGAGAISHYHNFTFYASKFIPAGQEIFVNYGLQWFLERQHKPITTKVTVTTDSSTKQNSNTLSEPIPHTLEWLKKYGRCLDNIKASKSKQTHAGRGAFATRFLPKGSVVAPVPLLVIGHKQMMDVTRRISKTNKKILQTKQLLLNYCYGHSNSSLLFFPYSPVVNFVNHGGGKHTNVKLQWSKSKVLHGTGIKWLFEENITIHELRTLEKSGLLLELVATQPIRTGDEILLDYGKEWIESWIRHVSHWKPPEDANSYAPAYVHDDVIQSLRTATELEQHPYPDNIFTSCFYRYSDNKLKAEQGTTTTKTLASKPSATTTKTFKWNMTRGIFDLNNLRPCTVLKRHNPLPTEKQTGTTFTVQIRNRPGLLKNEEVPKGQIHIVTDVPRHAIRFTDKPYTTDQHLPNTFRKSIELPNDLYFPKIWQDIRPVKQKKQL